MNGFKLSVRLQSLARLDAMSQQMVHLLLKSLPCFGHYVYNAMATMCKFHIIMDVSVITKLSLSRNSVRSICWETKKIKICPEKETDRRF